MKLGRKARARNPRVPHLSALLAGRRAILPPPPPSADYTKCLPADLGMMLNDSLGDCTCAGFGHARQVWTANANPPISTLPDSEIEQLYEACGGYQPGNSSTDNGCVEQDVLSYLLNTGLAGDKLAAFIEVDPSNLADVEGTIFTCGLAYIGFNVPAYLMNSGPPDLWDLNPSADQTIVGGHCVILPGYDHAGSTFKVISWGRVYSMTYAFFSQFTDECYALADPDWIAATGSTPGGLSLATLEQQMQALKE